MDWERIRARLAAAGYAGTRMLEVTNEFSLTRQGLTAEEFLRLAYERVSDTFPG